MYHVSMMAEKSEKDSDTVFLSYLDSTFPPDVKRSRSAMIRKALAKRIIDHLKGLEYDYKAFRHFVKKSCFQLLDFPSVGIRDALVIKLKQEKQVHTQCSNYIMYVLLPIATYCTRIITMQKNGFTAAKLLCNLW